MTQSKAVLGAMLVTILFGGVLPVSAQQVLAESRNPLPAEWIDSAAAPQRSTTFDVPAQPLAQWMTDQPVRRPAGLTALYATYAAVQVFDVYSTRRALGVGAHEANPIMAGPSRNSGAMLAVKALSTVGSIYFTERAWKKNRKGAVVLMAVLNAASAAIVMHNTKNVRAGR